MGLDWRLVEKVVDGKTIFPIETLGGRLLSRTNPEDVALAEAQLRADKEHGAAVCVPKFVRSHRQVEIPGRTREVSIQNGWLGIADETPPYKFVACPRMPSNLESMKVAARSTTDLEGKDVLPFAFLYLFGGQALCLSALRCLLLRLPYLYWQDSDIQHWL